LLGTIELRWRRKTIGKSGGCSYRNEMAEAEVSREDLIQDFRIALNDGFADCGSADS
jgi:hypothetical protein